MVDIQLQKLLWVYCPGHAGVKGNDRADRLQGGGGGEGEGEFVPFFSQWVTHGKLKKIKNGRHI